MKGSPASREVTATYVQDDFTLSVVVKLPLSFPFRRAEVDCSKTLGVPESRWKRWSLQITQMLNNQGGTLKDALLLWKENVDKTFFFFPNRLWGSQDGANLESDEVMLDEVQAA